MKTHAMSLPAQTRPYAYDVHYRAECGLYVDCDRLALAYARVTCETCNRKIAAARADLRRRQIAELDAFLDTPISERGGPS